MNYQQAVRFARHYRFMKGVPKRGFVMSWFFSPCSNGQKIGPPKRQNAECGTAACVAGWLCVAEPKHWTYRGDEPVLKAHPRYTPYVGFAAFFGMSKEDAYDVCFPSNYEPDNPTKSIVLARMVEVAKRNGWDIRSGRAKRIKGHVAEPTP